MIISCCSPTNASEESDITTSPYFTNSQHNVLIIGGDMNSQIHKDENKEFCLQNSPNRNGEYLEDFSLENCLLLSKFQKKGGKTIVLIPPK